MVQSRSEYGALASLEIQGIYPSTIGILHFNRNNPALLGSPVHTEVELRIEAQREILRLLSIQRALRRLLAMVRLEIPC